MGLLLMRDRRFDTLRESSALGASSSPLARTAFAFRVKRAVLVRLITGGSRRDVGSVLIAECQLVAASSAVD
jgi:hypothetical protein